MEYAESIPSAVYDAACAAAMQIGYKKPERQDHQRLSGLTGGYIEGSGAPPTTKKEPSITEEMKYMASQMGVPIEVYDKTRYEPDNSGTWHLRR